MHTSWDDLETRWHDLLAASPASGTIQLLVVRAGGGTHDTPSRISLDPATGIQGDRWFAGETPDPQTQVSLIDHRVVCTLVGGDAARWHTPGDNVVVDLDLNQAALPAGTRLRLGSAVIEISAKPHTGCHKFRARLGDEALRWVNAHPHRSRRLRGVYARIVTAGEVAVGDRVSRERA
jgi:hypothetical protein